MVVPMTEIRGQRARWSGAALVAPLAAVLFSGATAYSLHHDPHAVAAKAVPTIAPVAPKTDVALVSMRKTLLETAKQVASLRGQVASLRAAATGLRASSSSGGGGTVAVSSGSSGSSAASAPIVINVPAPAAPAPATHTTTGGS